MVSKENVSQQFFNDVIGKENDETGEDSTWGDGTFLSDQHGNDIIDKSNVSWLLYGIWDNLSDSDIESHGYYNWTKRLLV
jgi:hypothetical protein